MNQIHLPRCAMWTRLLLALAACCLPTRIEALHIPAATAALWSSRQAGIFVRSPPATARRTCQPLARRTHAGADAESEADDARDDQADIAMAPAARRMASKQAQSAPQSQLIASLLEDEPRAAIRAPLSPADMAELTAGSVIHRRNLLLAVASPLVGVAAFAKSRAAVVGQGSAPNADPLAMLQELEARSPPVQAALASGMPTVIEFYGPNCPNCKAMAPDISKLSRRFEGKVNFCVLNAERSEYASLVNLFKVDAIPHFAFMDADRQLLTTVFGFVPGDVMEKQLEAFSSGGLFFCGADECRGGTQMLRARANFYPSDLDDVLF